MSWRPRAAHLPQSGTHQDQLTASSKRQVTTRRATVWLTLSRQSKLHPSPVRQLPKTPPDKVCYLQCIPMGNGVYRLGDGSAPRKNTAVVAPVKSRPA